MIAAAWDASGRAAVDEYFARFADRLGAQPTSTISGPRFHLGVWPLTGIEQLDAEGGFAWIGKLSTPPDLSSVAAVSGTGGEYALIAPQNAGLLLARGRYAGRCVYYACPRAGAILACSRLEPLVAALAEPLTFDVRWMAAMIAAESCDDLSATVYRRIRRLRAGEALFIDSNGCIEGQCHELRSELQARTAEEAAEELRPMLLSAVARALQGRRHVAVMVSGGLDSSCVLANTVAIARNTGLSVDAVSMSVAARGDDRPYLSSLCGALGIVPHVIQPRDAADTALAALTADGAPQIWPTSAWELKLMQMARDRGAEVVLTGTGGDHVFCGDPRIFARRATSGHLFATLADLAHFQAHWSTNFWQRFGRFVLAPMAVAGLSPARRYRRRAAARRWWPWAGPKLREFLADVYERAPAADDWRDDTSVRRFNRFVNRDFLEIAEARGQAEAWTGCARVDPWLDDELLELVASFPQEILLHGRRTRGLFRMAMHESVPESVRRRTDKGTFEAAIFDMLGPRERSQLRELSKMDALAGLGLVEPRRFQQHFEAVLGQGRHSTEWLRIWPALSVEAFARQADALSAGEMSCRLSA